MGLTQTSLKVSDIEVHLMYFFQVRYVMLRLLFLLDVI